MKTFLAQNQFLSAASLQPAAKAAASSPLSSLSEAAVTNSAPVATPAADTAATNLCVQRSVAAEAIHSLGVVVDRGTAQRLEIELRNAGYFSGPTASGAVWRGENGCSDAPPCDLTRPSQFNDEPALDVPPGPRLPAAISTAAAGLSDDDLYWQLRFADDPFTRDLAEIPDPHAFFNKIIEIDVWADDAPLFLKAAI